MILKKVFQTKNNKARIKIFKSKHENIVKMLLRTFILIFFIRIWTFVTRKDYGLKFYRNYCFWCHLRLRNYENLKFQCRCNKLKSISTLKIFFVSFPSLIFSSKVFRESGKYLYKLKSVSGLGGVGRAGSMELDLAPFCSLFTRLSRPHLNLYSSRIHLWKNSFFLKGAGMCLYVIKLNSWLETTSIVIPFSTSWIEIPISAACN